MLWPLESCVHFLEVKLVEAVVDSLPQLLAIRTLDTDETANWVPLSAKVAQAVTATTATASTTSYQARGGIATTAAARARGGIATTAAASTLNCISIRSVTTAGGTAVLTSVDCAKIRMVGMHGQRRDIDIASTCR